MQQTKVSLKIIWMSFFVLIFVSTLCILGIRSLITKDARFGWAMFSYHTSYTIEYHLIPKKGDRIDFKPNTLQGLPAYYLNAAETKTTNYGPGAVKWWVRRYLNYKLTNTDNINVAQATLRYSVNGGNRHTETIKLYDTDN